MFVVEDCYDESEEDKEDTAEELPGTKGFNELFVIFYEELLSFDFFSLILLFESWSSPSSSDITSSPHSTPTISALPLSFLILFPSFSPSYPSCFYLLESFDLFNSNIIDSISSLSTCILICLLRSFYYYSFNSFDFYNFFS